MMDYIFRNIVEIITPYHLPEEDDPSSPQISTIYYCYI